MEQQLAAQINAQRIASDLPPLLFDQPMVNACRKTALKMTLGDRLLTPKVDAADRWATAKSHTNSFESTTQAWIADPKTVNVLYHPSATRMGVSVYKSRTSGVYYWVLYVLP